MSGDFDLVMMTAVVFGGVMVTLAALFLALAGTGSTRERALTRRLDVLKRRAAGRSSSTTAPNILRADDRSGIALLDTIFGRLLPRPSKLAARLARTGRSVPLGVYGLVCVCVGVFAFTTAQVFTVAPLGAALIGIAAGLFVPHLTVGFMIERRTRKFLALFPEALELIVRGLKSGLPVSEEITVIGREIADPVGTEFRKIADGLRFGQTLEAALWDAAKRLIIPDFNFFAIAIAIQRETGGNLSETMENLADIVRKRKQMKLKVHAMSSEARASAIIIGSLPFVMMAVLSFVSPDYVMQLFTDPRGKLLLGAGIVLQGIGALVMVKMVRFEDLTMGEFLGKIFAQILGKIFGRMAADEVRDPAGRFDPMSYLPSKIGSDDLIVGLAALAVFLVVVAVWRSAVDTDPVGRRLRNLAQRRTQMRDDVLAPQKSVVGRSENVAFMRRVNDKLNLMRSATAARVTDTLERAGWRGNDAVVAYLFVKFSLPLAAGAFALVFFYGLDLYNMQPLTRLLVSLGLVVVAFYVPEIYVRNAADKRRHKLRRGLPDGLDLMVICAEAGLSLDATLQRVSRELAPVHPEFAEELQLTSIELGFLTERRKALENLARRTALPQISGVVNTLAQTEKYGTPLAASLRVLATEFRNERLMAAEAKAAKLPATLTVPMVLFIMPVLFIVLLGSAVLRMIDSFGKL